MEVTDRIAENVLESIVEEGLPENIAQQYGDNIKWIKEAGKNRLVVGSQARILYADQRARVAIAQAFNRAIQGMMINQYHKYDKFNTQSTGLIEIFRG